MIHSSTLLFIKISFSLIVLKNDLIFKTLLNFVSLKLSLCSWSSCFNFKFIFCFYYQHKQKSNNVERKQAYFFVVASVFIWTYFVFSRFYKNTIIVVLLSYSFHISGDEVQEPKTVIVDTQAGKFSSW